MSEDEITRIVRTNAGMCALWKPESLLFEEFEEWEDWATENRRLMDSMVVGSFVPINVGGDGVFQISVRWGSDARLTEREERCLIVSSDPYLLVSEGWFVVSGLENVGDAEFAEAGKVPLDRGRYSVKVNLVDWKMEPGSADSTGKPKATALPDFVVLVGSESGENFRVKVQTFERQ